MTRTTRIARLRKLEFRRMWTLRLDYWLSRFGGSSSALDIFFAVLGLIIVVVDAIATVSVWRASYVKWGPGADLAAQFFGGLLAGIGTLIPAFMACRAGFVLPWDVRRRAISRTSRPVVNLMPLSQRQATVAALQGRGAAFLLTLVVGFAIVASARAIMLAGGADPATVPLVDPWILATVFVFYTLFVVTTVAGREGRRLSRTQGGGPAMASALYFVLLLAGAYQAGLLANTPWLVTVLAVLAAASVSLAALLNEVPRLHGFWSHASVRVGRSEARGEAVARAKLSWRRRLGARAVEGFYSPSIWGLGGDRGWRTRWKAVLAFGGSVVGGFILLSALWQVGSFLYVAEPIWMAGKGFAAGFEAQPAGPFQIAIFGPPFLFAYCMWFLGIGAWPEVFKMHTVAGGKPVVGLAALMTERPHIAALLPLPARRAWWGKLTGALAVALVLVLSGLVAQVGSWLITRALFWRGVPLPQLFWDAPVVLSAVAYMTAVLALALVKPAVRVLRLSGCLLLVIAYTGGTVGMVAATAVSSGHTMLTPSVHADLSQIVTKPVAIALGATFAWVGCLALLSWAWAPMSSWHMARDGHRPSGTKLQALMVWLALSATVGAIVVLVLMPMHVLFG